MTAPLGVSAWRQTTEVNALLTELRLFERPHDVGSERHAMIRPASCRVAAPKSSSRCLMSKWQMEPGAKAPEYVASSVAGLMTGADFLTTGSTRASSM